MQKRFVVYVLTCVNIATCFTAMYAVKHLSSAPRQRSRSRCNYVGFEIPKTGNGLGNHLFYYSVVTFVASLTGRRPCVWTKSVNTLLDRIFDIDIERVDINTLGCPLHTFTQKSFGVYDRRVESLVSRSDNESLLLKGPFQSWKYAAPIAHQLRQQLKFHRELIQFVDDFFTNTVPPGRHRLAFVRVGIHVRRGDFLSKWARLQGFTIADERYLQRAMRYFVRRFRRVQFIVASNDIRWCQKHVMFNSSSVNITFSMGHNTGQDMALLASCNHTVMTTGTFSWWAAWLANGITVYYANYPRRGSRLSSQMHNNDYYHPDAQ